MCRLLGFQSSQPSKIHNCLHDAENALVIQSKKHPDGWGVGYYIDDELFLVKSARSAFADFNFPGATKAIVSKTIICHVRQATVGAKKTIENCHPFTFGSWMFAHHGTIRGFKKVKPLLMKDIPEKIKKHIQGLTDSEAAFHLFISYLSKEVRDVNHVTKIKPIKKALVKTIRKIDELVKKVGVSKKSDLNFILTNGKFMLATCRGEKLYYTEHHDTMGLKKKRAIDKYFMICSERFSKSDAWKKVPQNSLVIVNNKVDFDIVPL